MSDRDPQADLRHQRELLREQLARIEQAMAAGAESPPTPAAAPKASTSAENTHQSAASIDADALLQRYAQAESERGDRLDPKAARRGCLLAFTAVFAALIAGVTVVYFLFYAHR